VSAGRLLLQRAAEAHDAQSALVLAGTYDPLALKRFGAFGVAADPVMARHWYEEAKALGSELASQRLDMLAEWLRGVSAQKMGADDTVH
jgi:TPR repeat protein